MLRQSILLVILLGVALWGWSTYRADHHTFAWDRTVSIAVVALFDDRGKATPESEEFVRRFLTRSGFARHNLREVENWLQEEYTRHSGDTMKVLEVLSIRGPLYLKTPPPALPEAEDSFLTRLQGTRRFLGYFEDIQGRKELGLGRYDLTLFIYFI